MCVQAVLLQSREQVAEELNRLQRDNESLQGKHRLHMMLQQQEDFHMPTTVQVLQHICVAPSIQFHCASSICFNIWTHPVWLVPHLWQHRKKMANITVILWMRLRTVTKWNEIIFYLDALRKAPLAEMHRVQLFYVFIFVSWMRKCFLEKV